MWISLIGLILSLRFPVFFPSSSDFFSSFYLTKIEKFLHLFHEKLLPAIPKTLHFMGFPSVFNLAQRWKFPFWASFIIVNELLFFSFFFDWLWTGKKRKAGILWSFLILINFSLSQSASMKKVKRSRIKTVDETEKIILPQILCSSPSIVGEPLRNILCASSASPYSLKLIWSLILTVSQLKLHWASPYSRAFVWTP